MATGSAAIVAVGIGMGLVLTALLAPLGAAMLYNVRAFDPATYVVIAATLGAVAFLASWLPARRATQVDPMIALRSE
jgi:putative ABC transport system permease protein